MKAILMSIQANHLAKILNSNKTVEIRKSIPKNFKGWVYLYCTKAKPYIDKKTLFTVNVASFNSEQDLNGFVVARFWFDESDKISNHGNRFFIHDKGEAYTNLVARNSRLDFSDLQKYAQGKDVYAWHIKNLEIFDKPIELGEFKKWTKKTIYCGMDCPPYVDEVLVSVSRAPQSWQYVEVSK